MGWGEGGRGWVGWEREGGGRGRWKEGGGGVQAEMNVTRMISTCSQADEMVRLTQANVIVFLVMRSGFR